MIKPLYDNVLLKKEKASNQTESGIIISSKEEDEDFAVVVAISDCEEIKVGEKVYKFPIKVNDKVMYKKYAGTDVKMDGEDYILIKASDILGII